MKHTNDANQSLVWTEDTQRLQIGEEKKKRESFGFAFNLAKARLRPSLVPVVNFFSSLI